MRRDGWGPDAAPPWNARPTFAEDADLTVYWPAVRPCWEDPTRRALQESLDRD